MAAPHPHEDHRSVAGGLVRASVFGINDGLVSNVSLILGFAASGVDSTIVRLAGLAGAVAGAVSMAAGEWVSISSQNDLVERELAIELKELEHNTEHETAELAAIYEGHGMEPQSAAAAAAEVMRSPTDALAVHAREELGVDPGALPSPMNAAILSLIAFLIGAFLPLVPWFVGSGSAATVASLIIGIVAAGVVGAVVGGFAERPLVWSTLRQVLIVLVACAVTYAIGQLFGITIS